MKDTIKQLTAQQVKNYEIFLIIFTLTFNLYVFITPFVVSGENPSLTFIIILIQLFTAFLNVGMFKQQFDRIRYAKEPDRIKTKFSKRFVFMSIANVILFSLNGITFLYHGYFISGKIFIILGFLILSIFNEFKNVPIHVYLSLQKFYQNILGGIISFYFILPSILVYVHFRYQNADLLNHFSLFDSLLFVVGGLYTNRIRFSLSHL